MWRKLGWKGFLGFNFFIGATPVTFLVYPLLLAIFIAYLVFDLSTIRTLFPDWVLFMSIFNLMVGNILMIYVNMIAVFKSAFLRVNIIFHSKPYILVNALHSGLYGPLRADCKAFLLAKNQSWY